MGQRTTIHGIALMAIAFACGGCNPVRPEDKAWFAERERQRAQRETRMRDVHQQIQPDELIKLVRQAPEPEGAGTNEDWLNRKIAEMGGQIMFPRWEVRRRASNKQEVSFQFLLIDDQNVMRRYVCAWEVDALAMSIAEPRMIALDEATPPGVHTVGPEEL